jgi:hypothetical protein
MLGIEKVLTDVDIICALHRSNGRCWNFFQLGAVVGRIVLEDPRLPIGLNKKLKTSKKGFLS